MLGRLHGQLRKHWRGWLVALLAGLLLASWWTQPTSEYLVAPGKTYAVGPFLQGGLDGPPGAGQVWFTTVAVHRASRGQRVLARFRRNARLVPERALLPRGLPFDRFVEQQQAEMRYSQAVAGYVALKASGFRAQISGPLVQVTGAVPGQVRYLDTLNHQRVQRPAQLQSRAPQVEVGLWKWSQGGWRHQVRRLSQQTLRKWQARAVGPAWLVRSPVPVMLRQPQAAGPSAGAAFALAVYRRLNSRQLLAGRQVAVTGMISTNGAIGNVAGIRQKTLAVKRQGLDLFIVPAGEVSTAEAAAGSLKVHGVRNFHQLVHYLDTTAAGVIK